MKTKMTVTMGILVAGLLVASTVFAEGKTEKKSKLGTKSVAGEQKAQGDGDFQSGEGRMGPRGRGRGDGFHHREMRGLNLTDAQRTKIDKIDAASRKDAEPIFKEMDGLQEKMHKEWRATKPNKNNIMALHRKMSGLNDRLAERRISDRLERIAVLTPQQRAEMIERMPEKPMRDGRGLEDGRGHGRGHGMKDGRGPRDGRGFKDGRGRNEGRGRHDGRGRPDCDGSGCNGQRPDAPAPKTSK